MKRECVSEHSLPGSHPGFSTHVLPRQAAETVKEVKEGAAGRL